jgi:hypothetical protein
LGTEKIWAAKGGRKRKKDVGKELKGVKLRKTSSATEAAAASPTSPVVGEKAKEPAPAPMDASSPKVGNEAPKKPNTPTVAPTTAPSGITGAVAGGGLGLGNYSSDDDD